MEGLKEHYNRVMERPLAILNIFNDFFGEERVDMQGFPTLDQVRSYFVSAPTYSQVKSYIEGLISNNRGFILVHFPRIRVTNEFDQSTEVKHLYAKVIIKVDGTIVGRPLLNRSEYTLTHFRCNYMHSHICDIPKWDFTQFQTPCTGSGPINSTICSLAREYNEDIWRLFCLELDKFVQVESIAGTPYHRLEQLSPTGNSSYYETYNQIKQIKDRLNIGHYIGSSSSQLAPGHLARFTKYVIDSGKIKFAFKVGRFTIGMRPEVFFITISNLFIEWYNNEVRAHRVFTAPDVLLRHQILETCKYIDGKIKKSYGNNNSSYNCQQFIGRTVCTFKGETVVVRITDIEQHNTEEHMVTLLNQEVASYIATKMLNVLNYKYGNKGNEDTPKKAVYFI